MTDDFIGCRQLNHAETKAIRQFRQLEVINKSMMTGYWI
jgi:hypothetical protein